MTVWGVGIVSRRKADGHGEAWVERTDVEDGEVIGGLRVRGEIL